MKKLINLILIKFDFIIRFLYVKMRLNRLFFWKRYTSNCQIIDSYFPNIKELLSRQNFDIKDKVVMELGSGNSYINAYNFLQAGARKVILLDKFPRNYTNKKQKLFFQEELSYFREKNKDKIFCLQTDRQTTG